MAGKGKTTLKSLRLSEEVIDYINSQPGENFSDKFDKLVYEMRKGESSRREKLRLYDKQLEARSNHLDKLIQSLRELDEINRKIGWVSSNVKDLVTTTKRCVLQNPDCDQAAAENM